MEDKKQKLFEQESTGVDEQDQTSTENDPSKTAQIESDSEAPVTVALPEDAKQPLAATEPQREEKPEQKQVLVEPNLSDLITGVVIPLEEEERAREQRNLDHAIHKLLIIGLITSASLMLFGLFLDLVLHRGVPTTIPNLTEVVARVIAFRPSGFLALGLLVLIATPVLRVVGSVLAFIYERDWRYAAITFTVLLVVILSVVMGKG